MPTEIISTLKPSGGDYTLMSTWEAAKQGGAWAADDEVPVLECYTGDYSSSGGGVDYIVDQLIVDGWTDTDSTHAPVIRAAAGHEFDGDVANGLSIKHAGKEPIKLAQRYTRFEHLKVEITASMAKWNGGIPVESDCVIDSCHLWLNAAAVADSYFITPRGTLGTHAIVRNSIIKMAGSTYSHYAMLTSSVGAGHRAKIYNCIFDDAGRGIFGGDSNNGEFKNNVFISSSNEDFYRIGSSSVATNATSKSSSTGCSIFSVPTSDFVDYANGDYHLVAGATDLIGAGTDLSGEFTDDVDGETRSAPWDVGLDHYVAGGAGAELAGDAAGQATAAAEATTGIPIAGAMLSIATGNGAISTGINIGGAASAISLLDGNIDTEIRVSVAAIIEALAQAGLDAQTLFEAAAAGQADAGGTLSGDGAALSAAAQAIADGNATITIAITMQGDALAEALAQAGLTVGGSGLEGDASAVADALAVMLAQINMIGGGSAVVTTLGGIDTILQMQGAAAAASNTLGGLTAQVQFNAQAFVQALVQAGLTTAGGGLEGDAGAVADANAWLKIKVRFDGAAVGEAVALGNLTTGAIDIPKIARWTVTAEKRNWTVEDKRSWEVCA